MEKILGQDLIASLGIVGLFMGNKRVCACVCARVLKDSMGEERM